MFFPIPPWDGDEEEGDAPSAAGAAAAALSTEPAAAACGPSPSYPAAPPLAGSGASRTAKKRAAAHAVSLAALTAGVVPLGRLADREKEGAGAAGAAADPADLARAAKKARREEQRQAKAAATPARPAEDAAADAAERKAAKKAARKAAKAAAEVAVATTAAPDPPTPPADAAPAATARPPSKKNKFKNGALAEVAAAVAPAAQEEEAPAPVPAPVAAAAPATNTTAAPAPARSKKVKPRQAAAAVLEPPTKDGNGEDQDAPAPAPAPARAPPPSAAPSTSLARLRGSLAGGAFRWLNEALYTRSGADGAALIGGDPALFDQYHAGFRAATKGWPAQPVELAAAALRARFGGGSKPGGVAVADFGCGDAALANVHLKGAGFTVTSLDLVADPARGIIAANTASRVPLPPASQDAVVLCLALMGRDYPATLAEAARVLKPGGLLWVAEVRSRFAAGGRGEGRPGPSPAGSVDDTRAFVRAVTGRLGCVLASSPDATNKMFVVFEFEKQAGEGGQQKKAAAGKKGVWPALRPCEYKRR